MNLLDLLRANARKFPDRDAVRAGGTALSFAELRRQAEDQAGVLQSWGIGKGDRVAIMSHNTPAFVTAFWAALTAGGVVVPVNHKLAAAEASWIAAHAGAKLFLFDAALHEVAAALTHDCRRASLDGPADGVDRLDGAAAPFTPVEVGRDDLAELLYTSGTTGHPKGCMHTHGNVIQAASTLALLTRMTRDDRILMAMPIWHSFPLNNLFMGAQYLGATTVLLREYHPLHFLQAIAAERCTITFGAPVALTLPLRTVPNFDEFDLSSMRCWMYGGGPIDSGTARLLRERYRSDGFYQAYGMTETGPTGTVLFPDEQVAKAGSIGRTALPGCDLRVVTAEGHDAKPGESGEIWLRAFSTMTGYYNDPEATAAAFTDGWYRSGDIARVDADGYLFIVDRLKDMIVSGGENIYSKEVEDALAGAPGVAEAAVIGIPHPEWGETVAAIIVPTDAPPTEDALRAHLAERLGAYKIPRLWHFVDALPRTPTGKLMKYKLRAAYAARNSGASV